jgi:hypothetical protein
MSDEPEETWKRPSQYSPRQSGEPKKPRSERPEPEASSKHPPLFSPEWHAKRAALLAEIAERQRRQKIQWTQAQRRTSRLAFELATLERGMVGFEQAKSEYEGDAADYLTDPSHEFRIEMTPDELRAHWAAMAGKPMRKPAEMAEADYPF